MFVPCCFFCSALLLLFQASGVRKRYVLRAAFMCVYTFVSTHACVHTNIQTYVLRHAWMHAYATLCWYVCMHVSMTVCVYVAGFMYACIDKCLYKCGRV